MESQRVHCGYYMFIGSMNPCPCGYWGDPIKECTCSSSAVTRYQKRISGPLIDRIDTLRDIEVPRVEYEKLSDERIGESSAAIRKRVEAAHDRQIARFKGTSLTCNADTLAPARSAGVGPAEVRDFCHVDPAGKSLLKSAMQQLQMSARAYHRILKLARTIADLALAGSEKIETVHLAEAIHLRPAEADVVTRGFVATDLDLAEIRLQIIAGDCVDRWSALSRIDTRRAFLALPTRPLSRIWSGCR